MNIKNLAVKGTMIAGAITAMGGIAILNYDQHPFYQDNLDAAYNKELRIERYIANEYQNIIEESYEAVKSYPEYKQMDSLEHIHAQNPEANWELEYKIDSLWNKIDSVRDEIINENITNSQRLNDAYQEMANVEEEIEILKRDSVINDSIQSQPVVQRFKNNWNRIFCQQKHK